MKKTTHDAQNERILVNLLELAQAGDPLSLQELCTRFTPLILRMAKYYQTDVLPMEDLIQSGYEQLLRAIREYDTVQGVYFSYFLKLRVRTGMWSYVRSANRVASRTLHSIRTLSDEEDVDLLQRIPDRAASASYELAEWYDLFDLLSPRERIAMEQLVIAGLTSTEVAATYGVSPETVKTWRKRAQKKLVQALRH
ncbi:sigma-70 family RNA polymerase sigma factor [Sulfoacidibacillus ferrooxidans]|uniref:RNA polymerase sigma factor FliA n=1 Tax=Sulfoacidibacillus ferrooxidans TaxID=2005001 RepID=A0A9X2ABT1_9BACL|nr:sigma-70 family RNA polymerase sigma factor [Sulfoacidibacillus ferrooxidans]MCI0183398.1 RNA polymerase sigma factor FliA [Sulfoacidibacillus ferrooxidans]